MLVHRINTMNRSLLRASPPRTYGPLALSKRERVDLVRYEDSLGDFTEAAWPWAGEPVAFQHNWHIDCLVDHLAAVAKRQIVGPGPLVFTMPPRHMKSREVNVFFPAWVWAQDPDLGKIGHGYQVRPGTLMGPGVKFAFISYVQKLSNEFSTQCSRLITSNWYSRNWGERVALDYDQIEHFSNTAGGDRRAMSFSSITGFGADIIVIDDAHDIENVESDVIRDGVLRAWDEVLQTRLNDPGTGIFIVIMQRSHENDLVGHILAREFEGMHVCLPAEFEKNHPYVFLDPRWPVPRRTDSSNGTDGGPKAGEIWHDCRAEGDPLWPARIPKDALARMAGSMTSHAAAGQFQQRPTAREGGLFKRAWFDNPVKIIPDATRLEMVRAWDFASTEGSTNDPDWTVGLLMGRDPKTRIIYIFDVIRVRASPAERERKVQTTAALDGQHVKIRVPQDPGASGKFEAHYFVSLLQGYSVTIERETSGAGPGKTAKERRADPFAAQCEHGLVKLIEGAWNLPFVEELCAFPNAAHDDQVDAAAAAFRAVVRRPTITAIGA